MWDEWGNRRLQSLVAMVSLVGLRETTSLTSVEERLPIFALLADDIQSATITDLACGDHEIAQLIYSMWTARFGWSSLTIFVSIIYDVICIPDSASLGLHLLPSAVHARVHCNIDIDIDIDIVWYDVIYYTDFRLNSWNETIWSC